MIVDPTKTGHATLATAQTARASTAKPASLFSAALASATTKATASSDTSSARNVSTSTKVPKGEKTEHVDGHSYDEVIAGPRDGMFINRSGNKRNGQAFALVKRDGREFHVYGTGKNRVIVEVKHKKDADKTDTPAPTTTDDQSTSSAGDSGTAPTTSPTTDTTGAPAS
jgi:hypothetical protein